MPDESPIDRDEDPRRDVDRGTRSRGVRTVSAMLPNGRVAWLRIAPPLASAVSVDQLAQGVEHAARWRGAAAQNQSEALARLARTVAADAERLSDGQLARARALRRRIAAGDRKIDRKLARAAEEYRSRVERQLRIERETVRRLARRDLWDQIVIATALPLFAAYGQQGRPFGANNIALTVSLLIWLVGDEIVDALFGAEEASPYPLRDTDAWSYVAPVGNLLAGWWLLHDLQHERFITGRVVIPPDSFKLDPQPAALRSWLPRRRPVPAPELMYRATVRIGLSPFIGPAHFADFETFTDVPAVATISAIRPPVGTPPVQIQLVGTTVRNGELTIALRAVAPDLREPGDPVSPIVDSVEVAWMVDTQERAAPATAS